MAERGSGPEPRDEMTYSVNIRQHDTPIEVEMGQTVLEAALAMASNAAADHPFAAKFRLFEAGHWPLGVYAGALYVF